MTSKNKYVLKQICVLKFKKGCKTTMKTNKTNTLEMLNIGVDEFYSYKTSIVEEQKVIEFKAILITFINQLERVFKGVFGKTFKLEDKEDIELFKELYPVMFSAATKEKGENGLHQLCTAIRTFRNLNAHAYSSCDYKRDLDLEYVLKNLPNKSKVVQYVTTKGIPTLAGMITILLFLSNDKAVSYFVANDIWNGFLEHLNYFGNNYEPKVEAFPEKMMEINRVNDEIDIRKPKNSKTMLDVIFGRFSKKVFEEDGEYKYYSEEEFEDSTFNVFFTITLDHNNHYCILVKKGSNYPEYFENDYQLTITDLDDFIDYSEKVPPFMFVAFLAKCGVTNYRKNSLTDKEKEFCLKLNKPKFYVDKNINTLLLPNTISDIRMCGQILSIGINYCLYRFELIIFKKYSLSLNNGYSQLRNALKFCRLNSDIVDRVVAIRNFFSHYYILGDSHIVGTNGGDIINLDFIILSFKWLIEGLNKDDPFKGKMLEDDFYYRVVCSLLLFKYNTAFKRSEKFMRTGAAFDYENLNKSIGRIKNSFITPDIEEQLLVFKKDKSFNYRKLVINNFQWHTIVSSKPICNLHNEELGKEISLITISGIDPSRFLNVNNCEIKKETDCGFIKNVVWSVD